MNRERKLTRRATINRQSVFQRRREEQISKMTAIHLNIMVEKKLVRTVKKILERIDNPRYRCWTRAVTMFDPLFIAVEPDPKRRRSVLMRIFKLRPRLSDAGWVNVMWKYQSSQQKMSLRYAIKHKLINKKV